MAYDEIRDSQRQRVYDAENALRKHPSDMKFQTQSEVVDFVKKVTSSAWFKSYSAPNVGEPKARNKSCIRKNIRVRFHNGRSQTASAFYTLGEIRLPGQSRWAWTSFVLLHEIAHMITWQGGAHGRQFVTVVLDLVEEFIGADFHRDLKLSYALHGVKGPFPYVPVKRKSRNNPVVLPMAASPASHQVVKKATRNHRYPLHIAMIRKVGKFVEHVAR